MVQQIETAQSAGNRPTGRRGLLTLAMVGLTLPLLGGGAGAQGSSNVRAPWQSQVAPLPTAEIVVGDETLTVELALMPSTSPWSTAPRRLARGAPPGAPAPPP